MKYTVQSNKISRLGISAKMKRKNGDLDGAIKEYKEILEISKETPLSLKYVIRLIGVLYMKKEDYKNSIKYFREFLDHHPDDVTTLKMMAECYLSLNEIDKALEIYLSVEKTMSQSSWCKENIGRCYGMKRNYKKALVYYHEALQLKPKDYLILNRIGYAHLFLSKTETEKKHLEEAVKYLKLAEKQKPDPAYKDMFSISPVLLGLSSTYYKLGDFDKSLKYYLKRIKQEPDDVWSIKFAAQCCYELKKNKKAIKHFKDAEKIEPNSTWATDSLLKLYWRENDRKKALEYAVKLDKLTPHDFNNIAGTGCLYMIEKDLKNAEKYLKKALKIKNDKFPLMYLGHVELCKKHITKAINLYKKSFKLFEKPTDFKKEFKDDFKFLKDFGIEKKEYMEILFKVC